MRLISLLTTPVALFVPSRSAHISAGKLALISMLITTFFLFTSGFQFPGGSIHYTNWAETIVLGTKLPPDFAQRDVGLPLLYLLSGFPFTYSFIGITLIYAAFAVLIPVLVFVSLVRTSVTNAFYMALLCIASLAPYTYMKFFYPDQAYIFFNLLAVTLLIVFLWSGQFRILYLFTLAALFASFTRTAGNLMYPVLMVVAFLSVRGKFIHYMGCVLIFVIGTGLYQWHRYEIFDMRNQPAMPSGKGMQTFYTMYLYLGDFGYRLSPDMGPKTKEMLEKLRQDLEPSVRDSALVKRSLPETPANFMEPHVYAYTPDQLIEKIETRPNEEYWAILLGVEPIDRFYFDVAKEIAFSKPLYVAQFTARNLWHMLFSPGYATTRYNVEGFAKSGLGFLPAEHGWGVISQDSIAHYGPRTIREVQFFPLTATPKIVQQFFASVENTWQKLFPKYVRITSVMIVLAWLGAIAHAVRWLFPRMKFGQIVERTGTAYLMGPVAAASALLLYEDLATAMFSQPVHRYFHLTEPLRVVIAGFGVAYIVSVLPYLPRWRIAPVASGRALAGARAVVAAIQRDDLLDRYVSSNPSRWIAGLITFNVLLFAWWASWMIAHTWVAR